MLVVLKNIKRIARLSEETECFSADVWVDGVKAGTVANHGHGGSNIYEPTALWQKLEDHAKTLPTQRVYGMDLQPDADSIVGDAYVKAQTEIEMARMMARKIVFVRDGTLRSIKCPDQATRDRWLKDPNLSQTVKGGTVLNLLPMEEVVSAVLALSPT